MKEYLTTAWCGIEELASEANAGVRMLKRSSGETVCDEVVYDEIEYERRKAAKAIRFALSTVEFVHEALSARAYGFGEFAVKTPSEGEVAND